MKCFRFGRKVMVASATLLVFFFACANAKAGPAIVVQPQTLVSTVQLGDTFTVNITANIPQGSAIVGWGMDFTFDPTILSHDPMTQVIIGPQFSPAPPFGGDGDMLAGLVFPPAAPVWGDSILLASLTFTAIAPGTTALTGGYTTSDPLEGFVMPGGQFATVGFVPGVITVVPAPSAALVATISFGLCGVQSRKRR